MRRKEESRLGVSQNIFISSLFENGRMKSLRNYNEMSQSTKVKSKNEQYFDCNPLRPAWLESLCCQKAAGV